MARMRERLAVQFDPEMWPRAGLSPTNLVLSGVVGAAIVAAILETEPTVGGAAPLLFKALYAGFALAFTAEYLVRLWLGGWRWAVRGYALIDLLATLVLWFEVATGLGGETGMALRLVAALRVVGLARRSRLAQAFRLFAGALGARSLELALSFAFAAVALLVAATLLYFIESQVQPAAFGSIPRAMWWAVCTLTTIGYGDVVPVTVPGKICAAFAAVTSIAIVAIPTGIAAAAFSDAFQRYRRDLAEGD